MSIKTSKRIALGVIAGLVFAPFAAIAPASAASTLGDIYFGTTTTVTASSSVDVGTATAVAITVSHTSDAVPTDVTLTPTLVKPAGSTATVAAAFLTYTLAAGTNQTVADQVVDATTSVITATPTAEAATATVFSPVIKFIPDVPGIYTLSFALDGAGVAGLSRSVTAVLTINAGYSAYSTVANRAFPTQGTNTTTGWAGIAGGQATVRITNLTAEKRFFVTTNTGAIVSGTEGDAGTNIDPIVITNGTNIVGGFNFGTNTTISSDYMDVKVTDTGSPATTTVTVKTFDAATGAATTFATATVTWGVAAAASARYSLLTLNAGAGTTASGSAADTTATAVSRTTAAAKNFTIQVVVKDQYDAALNAKTISATITGPGLIGISGDNAAGAATGRSLSQLLTGNVGSVSVWADGTAGEATVTISVGTVVLGSKKVTFYGSVATLTATQKLKVARATAAGAVLGTSDGTGTTADAITAALTPAVVIVAKDSAGVVVPGLTITGLSSNLGVISAATVLEAVGTALTTGAAGPGTYLASVTSAVAGVSGTTATVTFRTAHPTVAGTFISATPLTFALGGGVATETITFGKATYSPGEAMVVTLTAKDIAGNPVYDGVASPAVSFNKAVGGTAPAASYYVGGVKATSATAPTVFAPVTTGEFTARATSGNLAKTVITATASVPAPVVPVVPVVEAPQDKPTLTVAKNGGRIILSGTAVDGEGDIIMYVKKVGKTAWKERAKTLEVAAPGDFNGSIKAPKSNVLIRVKQEGTGLFSNQIIVVK